MMITYLPCFLDILQKNWVKTAIGAHSSGQSNLHTPIWGCHRQLDDQHRNPNMNNKDHIVGQLTTSPQFPTRSQINSSRFQFADSYSSLEFRLIQLATLSKAS